MYSRKYLAEHEADIAAYRTAQDTFRRLLSGAKLPKMDTLKAEFQQLAVDKKRLTGSTGKPKRPCRNL